MILEWAIGIIGTSLTASVGAVNARVSRLGRKTNEHSVAIGKIPAEMRVAVLTAMKEHEERNGKRFDGFQKTLGEIKTDIGILKDRRE